MSTKSYESVWDALEDTPQAAANMRLRAQLLIAIEREVRTWGETQSAAAQRLGITQPRLNDLLRGKITKFSLDSLVEIATEAGLTVEIEIATAA